MLETRQKLQELLAPVLESHNAFFIDIVLRHERGARLVQVFLDTDQGITVDECAAISRDFGRILDAEGLFDSPYRLEVSSPGIERPLRHLRQYHKNVGRRFNVTFRKDQERANLSGKLEAISGNTLTFLSENGEMVALDFSDIIEAKERLPW
jgi:ribosome maturation factor RimP